jgi:hypothetical protein
MTMVDRIAWGASAIIILSIAATTLIAVVLPVVLALTGR